eukprot:6978083-Prymnesium_polylepis.2
MESIVHDTLVPAPRCDAKLAHDAGANTLRHRFPNGCPCASRMGAPAHLDSDTTIRLLPGDRILVLRSAVLGGGRLPLRRERPRLAVSDCQNSTGCR